MFFAIAFVFISAIIGGFYFLTNNNLVAWVGALPTPSRQPTPTQSPITPQVVSLPPPIVKGQPIYVVKSATCSSNNAPAMLVQQQSSEAIQIITQRIAKTLGFTSSPTAFNGSRGQFSMWNEKGKNLVVGGNPLELSYSTGTPADTLFNDNINQELFTNAARTFLQSIQLTEPTIGVKLMPITYLSFVDKDPIQKTNPKGARALQLSYQYYVGTTPLFIRFPNNPSIAFQFNVHGDIISFFAFWPPALLPQTNTVAILPCSDAVQKLTSGSGILVDVTKNTTDSSFFYANEPPKSVVVDSTEFGYYLSSPQKRLAPLFVFRGTAEGGVFTTTTVLLGSSYDAPK